MADLRHVLSSDLTESCYQLFPMKMIFLEGHPLKTNGDVETALK
jgi:hypothetical protein